MTFFTMLPVLPREVIEEKPGRNLGTGHPDGFDPGILNMLD